MILDYLVSPQFQLIIINMVCLLKDAVLYYSRPIALEDMFIIVNLPGLEECMLPQDFGAVVVQLVMLVPGFP